MIVAVRPTPHLVMFTDEDTKAVDEIRCLCADMVQKANSGHPGGSIGMAPMAYVLFTRVLRFCPEDPEWLGRDRFVLSNGHCSPLLYSMLHLCGYGYAMDDLKQFRQLHSKTPGHPERVSYTSNRKYPGVEVTTGPLGQGIANAVGMAIAQQALQQYDPDGYASTGKIYVFVGDGCMQEGISSEASSLAGMRKLSNLIVLYDDNHITIDGSTALSFDEDVGQRYRAYNWNVCSVADGNTNLQAIYNALQEAQKSDKPTLIAIRTAIGYGTTKQDSASAHGAPLGVDSVRELKKHFGMNPDVDFEITDQTRKLFAGFIQEKQRHHSEWTRKFANCAYREKLLERFSFQKKLSVDSVLDAIDGKVHREALAGKATRNISQACLQALHDTILGPYMLVGCADLMSSCMTAVSGLPAAQYVHYGVREMAMVAISNGIAAFGGFVPFDATFMSFFTYCLGSIRVGALSRLHVVHIFTHDSIAVGEDGCTHQPVEILAQARAMIGVYDWRPCDCDETVGCYAGAMAACTHQHVLSLTRQGVARVAGSCARKTARHGGYVIYECPGAKFTLLSSGSELALALAAGTALACRVVSVPSYTLFCEQSAEYRSQVLAADRDHCISIEPYVQFGWERLAAHHIGIETYGVSAPAGAVARHFRMDADSVRERVAAIIAK